MEQLGFFVVVAEAKIKYKAPAFYEDRVVITSTLERARGKVLTFSYTATRSDGTLLCAGETRHVVIGADRRPCNLPTEWVAKMMP